MKAGALVGLLGAALVLRAAAYDCPAALCNGPTCHPGSNQPTDKVARWDLPQFIVLSNDDALTRFTHPFVTNITERHANRNGCKMPATWFLSVNATDPKLVQQVYLRGHEIATQMVGAKIWLNQTAGIPEEDIQGFRAPELQYSPEQRSLLSKNGYRYDSSITEQYGPDSLISKNTSQRLWPYTMDCGIAQNCSLSGGTCIPSEGYPGLWEFPLYAVQDTAGEVLGTMDIGGDVFEAYKQEFDARYNGNRAPLAISLRSASLIANPNHGAAVNNFIDYAMTHEFVFLVTYKQVLDWMENPVPATQYSPNCKKQVLSGVSACEVPTKGCGEGGVFNVETCLCQCENEMTGKKGYCRDDDGSCTVEKVWNRELERHTCPAPVLSKNGTISTATLPYSVMKLWDVVCAHPPIRYVRLSSSGRADPSVLIEEAHKAVDDACSTCARLEAVNGRSFIKILLGAPMEMSGVMVLTGRNSSITVCVGEDDLKGGPAPVCTEPVMLAAHNPTTIPVNAKGSNIIVLAPNSTILCDVYPIEFTAPSVSTNSSLIPNIYQSAPSFGSGAPSVPGGSGSSAAPAVPGAKRVIVEMDIQGTVDSFKQTSAGALCQAMVRMSGDSKATCELLSAEPNGSRRRLLQASPLAGTIHVIVAITTVNPESVANTFSNGVMLANLLLPTAGVRVTPATTKAYIEGSDSDSSSSSTSGEATPSPTGSSDPSSSSGSSSDSGSSSNVGAIVGGVIGGLAGLALIAGIAYYVVRRRREKQMHALTSRMASVTNPMYDESRVTATVTIGGKASAKQPLSYTSLKEKMASLLPSQQQDI